MITHKIYQYKNGLKVYYLVIGDFQFGPPLFSLNEVNEAIEKLKQNIK